MYNHVGIDPMYVIAQCYCSLFRFLKSHVSTCLTVHRSSFLSWSSFVTDTNHLDRGLVCIRQLLGFFKHLLRISVDLYKQNQMITYEFAFQTGP